MTVPFSTVKAGRTLPPVLLTTARVTWLTVASWPVVCTDWIDTDSGLAAVTAALTATALAPAPASTTHFQCRHDTVSGGRRVVAAAAIAAGISMTR